MIARGQNPRSAGTPSVSRRRSSWRWSEGRADLRWAAVGDRGIFGERPILRRRFKVSIRGRYYVHHDAGECRRPRWRPDFIRTETLSSNQLGCDQHAGRFEMITARQCQQTCQKLLKTPTEGWTAHHGQGDKAAPTKTRLASAASSFCAFRTGFPNRSGGIFLQRSSPSGLRRWRRPRLARSRWRGTSMDAALPVTAFDLADTTGRNARDEQRQRAHCQPASRWS